MRSFLTLLAAAGVGALAGFVTGVIHVRLKVRDLLAGIITMTALFSINLQIAGSNLAVDREIDTIFTARADDGAVRRADADLPQADRLGGCWPSS